MKPFQRIFASSFIFYSRFKYETPFFSAVMIVSTAVLLMTALLVSLLKLMTGTVLLPKAGYAPIAVVVAILIFFLVNSYFKRTDSNMLLNDFKQLPAGWRRMWAWITGMIIPVLAILIGVVLVMAKK